MEDVEHGRHDAGHVDGGVDHPLQLKTVGDCLDHARERVGVEFGVRIRGAEVPRERSAQTFAAVEEVAVRGMLGIGRVHGQPGEQGHEPRDLGVVADHVDERRLGLDVAEAGRIEAVVLVALAEHLGEEFLLRAEVVQQRSGGHADHFGDLLEGGILIPLAPDHVEGAFEDLLASRNTFRV